jgi:hypothetical protein
LRNGVSRQLSRDALPRVRPVEGEGWLPEWRGSNYKVAALGYSGKSLFCRSSSLLLAALLSRLPLKQTRSELFLSRPFQK